MKVNELKVTDLKVGDWVRVISAEPNTYRRPFYQIITVEKMMMIRNRRMVVEPIPLTPEILEKNFELLYRKKSIYIYSGIKGRFIIQNHYNVKGWDWSLDYDKQTGTASAFGRVNYIHELQHCLRGNRIEKEIVV